MVRVADGACLDLSITGLGSPTNPYIISGQVLVDGTTVVCGANGLSAQVTITPLDTDSIDMHVTGGPSAFVISSDVFIQDDGTGPLAGTPGNPAGSNLLKLNPGQGINGLYVSCEDIQDCIGSGIGTTLAGTCLVYDDAANKINVEIDPTPGNTIGCGTGPAGTGLFVSPAVCVPVPVTPTTDTPGNGCLSITGDTCTGLGIHLGISDDLCNGIQCHGNGLWSDVFVPNKTAAPVGSCPGQVNFVNLGPAPQTYGPTLCATITNPSACHSMAIFENTTGDNITVIRASGALGISLEHSFDGGATFSSFNAIGVNDPGGPGGVHLVGMGGHSRGVGIIPPLGSQTICVRVRVNGDAGGGGNYTGGFLMCINSQLQGIII